VQLLNHIIWIFMLVYGSNECKRWQYIHYSRTLFIAIVLTSGCKAANVVCPLLYDCYYAPSAWYFVRRFAWCLFFSPIYLQDTCRTAAQESCHSPEVQRTSVQKLTNLLCPFPFQFSLETINCLCHHRIIIQHIPLGHHSMREEILSNILVAPTFNQLQWMSPGSSCCINLKHIC